MAEFQFSIELTKLIPMILLGQGLEVVLSFTRELKKSGSDLLVESDLVAILGRGRVDERIKATMNEILRDVHSHVIYDRGGNFVPRCVTHVREQKEYFTACRDAFLSTLRLQLEERPEEGAIRVTNFGCRDGASVELAMSYRELHRASWKMTYATPFKHADGTLEGS